MALDALPALSMSDRRNDPDGFARAMGESYARFGFAIVRDHGLDAGVIERALDATKEFFALPEDGEAALSHRRAARDSAATFRSAWKRPRARTKSI